MLRGTHTAGQRRSEEVHLVLSLPLTISEPPPVTVLSGIWAMAEGNKDIWEVRATALQGLGILEHKPGKVN